jgi:hypothetical protein
MVAEQILTKDQVLTACFAVGGGIGAGIGGFIGAAEDQGDG